MLISKYAVPIRFNQISKKIIRINHDNKSNQNR